MKTCERLDVSTYILTSVLVVGEWSASRSVRFTPREGTPDTHWLGGWMGPSDSLEDLKRRIILHLQGIRIPTSWVVQPIASLLTE
jgi:hypothetical protein